MIVLRDPANRPDIMSLVSHPFVVDVSLTLHDFIPLSPPPTPPPMNPAAPIPSKDESRFIDSPLNRSEEV